MNRTGHFWALGTKIGSFVVLLTAGTAHKHDGVVTPAEIYGGVRRGD